jgi:ParB/RepB/Spo0J family partition protein
MSLRLKTLGRMKNEDQVRTVMKIDLDDIIPDPSQPRKEFSDEKIAEMSRNLIKRGQLQPILVRENPEGNPPFMVFDGEYRWRSAKLKREPAQLEAVVYSGDVDPDVIKEGQFLINEMRTDMSFQDRARFFQDRIARYGSVDAVAKHLEMNSRRIWRVLQAISADGAAGEARDAGLTNDADTLNAIDSLQKQNPAAAQALVQAGKEEGRITRKQVTDAVRAAKTKTNGEGKGDKSANNPPAAARHGKAASSPAVASRPATARVLVGWEGGSSKGDGDFQKRWKAMAGKGGSLAYLSFAKQPTEGFAWVCFGADDVLSEFPLAGLRLKGIVVPE